MADKPRIIRITTNQHKFSNEACSYCIGNDNNSELCLGMPLCWDNNRNVGFVYKYVKENKE